MAKYNINHSVLDKMKEFATKPIPISRAKVRSKIDTYALALKSAKLKVKILSVLFLIETVAIIYLLKR